MTQSNPKIDTLLSDAVHTVIFPLIWGDMDAFGHLNNVMYFRYFESARIAYFENRGFTMSGKPGSIGPILADTQCRFRVPLVFPDRLHIGTRIVDLGKDRFTMEYTMVSENAETVAAVNRATIVSFDYDRGKKAPLPDDWKSLLVADYEKSNVSRTS